MIIVQFVCAALKPDSYNAIMVLSCCAGVIFSNGDFDFKFKRIIIPKDKIAIPTATNILCLAFIIVAMRCRNATSQSGYQCRKSFRIYLPQHLRPIYSTVVRGLSDRELWLQSRGIPQPVAESDHHQWARGKGKHLDRK